MTTRASTARNAKRLGPIVTVRPSPSDEHARLSAIRGIMPPNPDTRVAVTVAEMARRMSISKATAYDWVRSGLVPSIRIKGCIRIPVTSLQRAIESGCRPSCQCICHEGAA